MADEAAEAVAVGGSVAPGFEGVRAAFEANFAHRGEAGAACTVYVAGRAVVDLWGGTAAAGTPYTGRTVQLVASATKGALAICALRLVERGLLDLDAPVAAYWPEFAAVGKADLPVRFLLAHRAGLPYVDGHLTVDQLLSWDPLVEALAAQEPVWAPGTAHGYHAITYGHLVGEVLARVTGHSPGAELADSVAGPLGLDLAIGLPAADCVRVAPLIPAPPPAPGQEPDELTRRLADPASAAHRAFFLSSGLFALLNHERLWRAQVPAANGIGSAHALARMYAATIGEVDGIRLLEAATVAEAARPHAAGTDAVTGYQTRYGLGFQLPFPFRPLSGGGSFGHYGLGGAVGFADPDRGFAFGYAPTRMAPALPADARSGALVDAVLACLR